MHRADVLGDVLRRGEALAAALAVVEERGVLLLRRLVPDVRLHVPVKVPPNVNILSNIRNRQPRRRTPHSSNTASALARASQRPSMSLDVLGDVLRRGEALATALTIVEERGVLLIRRLVPDVRLHVPDRYPGEHQMLTFCRVSNDHGHDHIFEIKF